MALILKFLIASCVWLCYKEVYSAPRIARLSLAEPFAGYYFNRVDGYPGAYTFGYDISDPGTGNMQYRNEERYPNGTVVGSYGYLDPFGSTRRYQYVADEKGYRLINNGLEPLNKNQIFNVQKASTEPSITWTRPNKYKKKKMQETKPNRLSTLTNSYKYLALKPSSYYAVD